MAGSCPPIKLWGSGSSCYFNVILTADKAHFQNLNTWCQYSKRHHSLEFLKILCQRECGEGMLLAKTQFCCVQQKLLVENVILFVTECYERQGRMLREKREEARQQWLLVAQADMRGKDQCHYWRQSHQTLTGCHTGVSLPQCQEGPNLPSHHKCAVELKIILASVKTWLTDWLFIFCIKLSKTYSSVEFNTNSLCWTILLG